MLYQARYLCSGMQPGPFPVDTAGKYVVSVYMETLGVVELRDGADSVVVALAENGDKTVALVPGSYRISLSGGADGVTVSVA